MIDKKYSKMNFKITQSKYFNKEPRIIKNG